MKKSQLRQIIREEIKAYSSSRKMSTKELISRIKELEKGKFSNENARELKDLRAELNYRQNFIKDNL